MIAVQVPEGVDWAKLNAYIMDKYRCFSDREEL